MEKQERQFDISLTSISALAELERIGWEYEPAGGDEIKCKCPAHEDSSPSCTLNVVKRLWKCHAGNCGKSGDLVTFIALALSRVAKQTITRATVWEDLSQRYGLTADKTIDSTVVEQHHEAIWSAGPLLAELRKRGISDAAIRRWRLGYNSGRISIPVMNSAGQCVNIRKYLPGAPGAEKMKNLKGHGAPRIYPHDQFSYDKIIVCGGEMKALATADRMNELGYGAVCLTAGEGEGWSNPLLRMFRGKRVYVCMDIDDAGKKSASKLCGLMTTEAAWVGNLDLTNHIDGEKFPKGDINDYWGHHNKTPDDLLGLLSKIAQWSRPVDESVASTDEARAETEPLAVHLSDATSAQHTGKRIKFRGTVTAMDTTPYLVPCNVKAYCSKDQPHCDSCPVFVEKQDDKGAVQLTVPAESSAILSIIRTGKKGQTTHIKEALRIPSCKVVTLRVISHRAVEDAFFTPQLEITSRAADQTRQQCYVIGKGLEANASYDVVGRVFPHPGTQQAIVLASKALPAEDALSTYKPSEEELQALSVFCAGPSIDDVQTKLDDIYADLSLNVTRIYRRQSLHLTIDLAYHSALLFKFDDRLTKGWVEVLVAGDSSQGKSEVAAGLMRHYGLGEKVDCKNASAAGLLGGLQQLGSRWFVTWGVIPTHDKRLVVLEELKGASTEVIGRLTDMRSSGIAEIPRIEKRRAHARTRLVALSNPRGDRPLSRYNFGIEAITELIGGLEDVRRFDFALLVAAGEVGTEEINTFQRDMPKVEHKYTASLSRKLLLWVWTRAANQIVIPRETMTAIVDASIWLCSQYSETVPLVDRGSMRHKIARLSIALAARLFSHPVNDMMSIEVRPEHVEYVKRFIDSTYRSSIFGYRDYSLAVMLSETLIEPDTISDRLINTPFPRDLIEQLLGTKEIECRDLADWCGWDMSDAVNLLSFLVRKHALQRDGRSYRKTSSFIEHLKKLLTSPKLKSAEAPSFAKEVKNPY